MEVSELRTCVASQLREGCTLTLIHLSSRSGASNRDYESHMFVAVQNDMIIYALELMIYTRLKPAFIYVSKVDTTGCHEVRTSPIAGLTHALLRNTIDRTNDAARLCLFARSQPQYLFPYSSQNSHKHILGDTVLIKWWLKTLEDLRAAQTTRQIKGYLAMPGADTSQPFRLLPDSEHWSIGHPYSGGALASECIPEFPDDPKARLLADLRADGQDKTTHAAQFWELLGFRQEICSGHATGFIMLDISSLPGNAGERHIAPSSSSYVDYKSYKKLQDALQRETYANKDDTKRASQKWIKEVRAQYPASCFDDIHGVVLVPPIKGTTEARQDGAVNVLVPRKKKRKLASESQPTNELCTNLKSVSKACDTSPKSDFM